MNIELREFAANLREVRRYARCHPVIAGEMAIRVIDAINTYIWESEWHGQARLHFALRRLGNNLLVGVRNIRSQPELLERYAACAAAELDVLAGPIEVP